MANERYFRQHPEINGLLQLYVQKVLDDRPENVLEYAGTFFDSASLRDIVSSYMAKSETEEQKNKHLSDLIKGKTLIWMWTISLSKYKKTNQWVPDLSKNLEVIVWNMHVCAWIREIWKKWAKIQIVVSIYPCTHL